MLELPNVSESINLTWFTDELQWWTELVVKRRNVKTLVKAIAAA